MHNHPQALAHMEMLVFLMTLMFLPPATQALARMEMQVFLVTLLGRFRLGLAPRMGSPREALDSLRYHLTLSLPDGLWIKAQPRG